jgi:capsular exopolysaccharide synthesis family protein
MRAMVVRDAELAERKEPGWAELPALVLPPAAPAPSLSSYFHALRRHWALALVLGAILGGAAGAGVWYGYGTRFEATAYLKVAQQPGLLVFRTAEARTDYVSEFDIYKGTQMQYLKNPFVLLAALRKPEVKQFNIDQREANSVGWLAEQLKIAFPGKAEIMEVRLVSRDPAEAKTLVEAVVNAYLSEVVEAAQVARRQKLDDLDRQNSDLETRVREKRSALGKLTETVGTSDPKTISLKQQIALQTFAEYQRQHMQIQFELNHARRELGTQEALLANIDDLEISPQELDALTRADPLYKTLGDELFIRQMALTDAEAATVPGSKSRAAERTRTDLQKIESQFKQFEDKLREQVRDTRRAEMEKEKLKWQLQVAALAEQEQEFAKEVDLKRADAEKLSHSSMELEAARDDMENLKRVEREVGDELEKLRVELKAPPRVSLIKQATDPESEYLPGLRFSLTAMTALAGFCLPVGLILWWDLRAQRVNSPSEVSKGLGLRVIGSMPLIPTRVVRRLTAPPKRYQSWQLRLSESIDSIAARLLRHQNSASQPRAVLVSSAVRGEGKTTLATQLALSLARNGRRTVLLDFDLRRPSLAALFKLPAEPGLCEVLRGQNGLAPLVHPTATENLSLVTAGRWDRLALAALANGATGAILAALRAEHEFIVIDASPILPVADTRFISQHVDAVVLSVFRDISQAPKVLAACEILEAFGARSLEAVVIGPNQNLRDKELGY